MSVQFGRWNFDGQSVDPDNISRIRTLLSPYAPDAITVCVEGAFCIWHGAFHTTNEARRERPPSISRTGTYLTWTGRLDNREDLTARLVPPRSSNSTDLEIVSSLYEVDGSEALGHFVGDWSLSALQHDEGTLLLAVDFLGIRPLYYFWSERYVAWSSVLEPLVVLAGSTFHLSEDYAAAWLYGFPAADLTPYKEIRSVPPASSVEFTRTTVKVRRYWEFRPQQIRRCRGDAECEAGFRHFFTKAVRRRLRSSGPVVSELSGGMDSSSIVCVADQLLKTDPGLAPRLDTLSYLNDAERDWNERPFVEAVEHFRGMTGYHVDVGGQLDFIPERDPHCFPGTPALGTLPSLPQRQVSKYLVETNLRVILSGLGGDETTGGVPDGSAELADLLVQGRWATFLRQAVAWCLPTRRPLIYMIGGVLSEFPPQNLFRPNLLRSRVPWISKKVERTATKNPAWARLRLKLHGPRPSIQENLYTLDDLRRQIACAAIPVSPPRERRYPFLDRDLLEFLYNTPREQIVRPGRRRSLMRRALSGIVPEVILERSRKAYVSRNHIVSFQALAGEISEWTKNMVCAELGVIDLKAFHRALAAAYRGEHSRLWQISKTLTLESWLRDERVQKFIRLPDISLATAKAGECRPYRIWNRDFPAG